MDELGIQIITFCLQYGFSLGVPHLSRIRPARLVLVPQRNCIQPAVFRMRLVVQLCLRFSNAILWSQRVHLWTSPRWLQKFTINILRNIYLFIYLNSNIFLLFINNYMIFFFKVTIILVICILKTAGLAQNNFNIFI